MLQPIDSAPASRAPRLAASMIPGPPPVMIPKPASPISRAVSLACAYCGWSDGTRAEPNTVTAGPMRARVSNPATNSPMMRNTRHGSDCVKSMRGGASAGDWRRRSSSVGPRVREETFSVGESWSGLGMVVGEARGWPGGARERRPR